MEKENIKINEEGYGYNFIEIIRIFSRKKNLLLSSFIVIFLAGFAYSILERMQNPTFVGSFTLLVEDPFKKNDGNPELNNFVEDIASYKTINDIPSIIEVLRSRNLLDKISKKNDVKYEKLIKSLKISKGGNIRNIREEANGILKISYFGKDKNEISNILNDLSKQYLSYSLQQRQDRIKEGLEFLNSQNPGIKDRLVSIQEEIEELRTLSNSADPINQSKLLDESKINFENEKSFLNIQLKRLLKAKEDLNTGDLYATSYKDIIKTTEEKTASQNAGLSLDYLDQGSLVELEDLKKKLSNLKRIYTPEHELVKSIERKILKLEPKVRETQNSAIEAAISSTKLKLEELNERELLNSKKYSENSTLIRKFDVLKLELDLAKENYNAFNLTKEKFRLGIAQNNFPWQLITYPNVSKEPIKPNLQKRFFQNLLFTFLASTGIVILKDNLENYFHSPYEVKALLNKEILGSIPYLTNISEITGKSKIYKFEEKEENLSRKEILKINKEKRNIYSFKESFKFLVNSLTLQKKSKNIKLLNFTSTVQGEDKTQTSIELAKMLNKMSKKTLLIDADLRKPKIHKRLSLNNDIGLSSLFSYESENFKKLIQDINEFPNLKIITAGPIIEDPYRIFNSTKFEDFIIWLRSLEEYEYILFDSAQSLFIADTNLLNNKVDYSILIVSLFKVNKDLIQESISNIKLSDGEILGVITVNTKDNELIGYNYGINAYTYGYGYEDYLNNDNFLENIYKNLKQFFKNLFNF